MNKQFSRTLDGVVAADWVDANGHMNVKHYFALFEDANWAFWARLKGHHDDDLSMVAGRIFIEHRLELHENRPFEVLSACQPWDSRSLLFLHRLKARDGKREIAAAAEFLASAFSLSTRQSVALPIELQDIIREQAIAGIKPRLAQMLVPTKPSVP